MHIAFLTPEYPHPKIQHSAGLGTSIKNLVAALVRKDVKVTVFVYGQPKAEVFEENGILPLNTSGLNASEKGFSEVNKGLANSCKAIFAIRTFLIICPLSINEIITVYCVFITVIALNP